MSSESDADLIVPDTHGVLPKAALPCRWVRDLEHIVDEDIEMSMVLLDLCKNSGDLIIVKMVGLDWDSLPSCLGYFPRCGFNGSWSITGASSSDVDSSPLFS